MSVTIWQSILHVMYVILLIMFGLNYRTLGLGRALSNPQQNLLWMSCDDLENIYAVVYSFVKWTILLEGPY